MQFSCLKCKCKITDIYKKLETLHGNAVLTEDCSNVLIKAYKLQFLCSCKRNLTDSLYVVCKNCSSVLGWVVKNKNSSKKLKYVLLIKNLSTVRT
jgi:hypothetical protein